METTIEDYIGTTRDPFPHSLLSTRQLFSRGHSGETGLPPLPCA